MLVEFELDDVNPETGALGDEQLKVLTEFAIRSPTTKATVITAAQRLGIGRTQCHELLRRFRQNSTVTLLVLLPSVVTRAGVMPVTDLAD